MCSNITELSREEHFCIWLVVNRRLSLEMMLGVDEEEE
jgi:hypothetical protein